MKIAIVISWAHRGGSTTLASEIGKRLAAEGHIVHPYVVEKKGDEIKECGEWSDLGGTRGISSWSSFRKTTSSMREAIRKNRPDVVHSFLYDADMVAAWACWREGVPHLCYLLDRRNWLKSGAFRHRVKKYLYKRLLKASRARFVAVSSAAQEYFIRHLPYHCCASEVLYNSVDCDVFLPATRGNHNGEGIVIGAMCRLVAEKGLRYLLDAGSIVAKKEARFKILIAGAGPDEQGLKEQARELRLEEKVEFLGDIPSALAFYQSLDVFVVPSIHSEGLPTTILEAMACGLSVIASDTGGACEAIVHGETGWLTVPGDTEGLAQCLLEVASMQPTDRLLIGSKARDRVLKSFSYKQLISRLVQIYEEEMK